MENHCIEHELKLINRKLDYIIQKENKMAETLDSIFQKVTSTGTVEDSLIALLTGVKGQLDAALAGGITPAQQAKMDAIFAAVSNQSDKAAAAIVANTPAA